MESIQAQSSPRKCPKMWAGAGALPTAALMLTKHIRQVPSAELGILYSGASISPTFVETRGTILSP